MTKAPALIKTTTAGGRKEGQLTRNDLDNSEKIRIIDDLQTHKSHANDDEIVNASAMIRQ